MKFQSIATKTQRHKEFLVPWCLRGRSYSALAGLIYLFIFVSLLCGCANPRQPAEEKISPGEVKVSFFQLTRGKTTSQPIGIYVAMISRERNVHYGLKLDEIFEQINVPQVSAIDDETAGELFNYLNRERFFNLKETPLSQFNLHDLKMPDSVTKVISVEINGVKYSVCYDNLPQDQQKVFNRIQEVLFTFLSLSTPKAAIEFQDWRELMPEGINK
ncbi:MAG: hypothetical protein V1709_10390 [Planctomycetota bacterium]